MDRGAKCEAWEHTCQTVEALYKSQGGRASVRNPYRDLEPLPPPSKDGMKAAIKFFCKKT